MENESIFADVPREGETLEEVFNSVEKEPEVEKPAESQAEKEIEKLELPDEEQLAIQKRNTAFEEMRKTNEELASRLESLEKEKEQATFEQPEFLKKMIGENEEVTKDWQKEKEAIKEEVKQELIREQAEIQRKEAETKAYWNTWTLEQLDKVGAKDENTRNELKKVMADYTPTDEQGNLDYSKGMKLLTDLKKAQIQQEEQKVQAKKNIADATVSKETSNNESKDYVTSHDLRKKGWRGL